MQRNQLTEILMQSAPFIIILTLALFLSLKVRNKNQQDMTALREQDVEKHNQVVKYNSYLRLSLWLAFGLFWLAGGIYNALLFPEGNKLPALFMICLGIGFGGFSIWSYFKKGNKTQK